MAHPSGPEARTPYPLTPLQHGMLVRTLLAPASSVNFDQVVCTLPEAVDPDRLERAWSRVAERYEVLRTRFRWEGVPEPVQEVVPRVPLEMARHDFAALDPSAREERLRRWLEEDRARGFDLAQAPVMRLALFRLAGDEHLLVWSVHHILIDGQSATRILHEVFALYDGAADPAHGELPEPRQFREHVEWLRGRDPVADEAYWTGLLRDLDERSPLRAIRRAPRDPETEPASGERALRLSPEADAALRAFKRERGVSLNTLVQGAWALLLGRYTGAHDVVFGTVRAGRDTGVEGAREMVGLLINTVPVRVSLPTDARVIDWLKGIARADAGLRRHKYAAIPDIQRWSGLAPSTALFESILNYQPQSIDASLRATGGKWEGRSVRLLENPGYPLALVVTGDAPMHVRIAHDADLFDAAAVDRMLGHFARLLEEMTADPERRLGTLDLLGDAERRQVLEEWNRTDAAHPAGALVHELFEAQADRNPGALAVTSGDETLTYQELDERANRLARFLRRRGVGPDARVAVCAKRGPELIVSLLAVLKAGGAYVPLDPAYPAERLEMMLADSGAAVLLTQEALDGLLPPRAGVEIVRVDAEWAEIAAEIAGRIESGATARSLAYVVYTSGSTGTPKGVAVEHGGLASLCAWHARAFAVTASDRATQLASPGFDAAGWEIWPYLAAGAAIDIVPDEVRADPEGLRDWLVGRSISIAFVPTPVAEPMLGLEWPRETALRWLLAGGDRLRARPAADLPFTVSNNYGPTECTVVATSGVVEADGARTPSIGGPIHRTRVYVLDARMQPVPIGVPGELHVGGAQVARGYLNRPGMTAERFVPDPFGGEPGARLYRTGDRVCWRECESARVRECERTDVRSCERTPASDEPRRTFAPSHSRTAVLEFLGRLDEQVKVRGFRIEPGEIEAALRRQAGVRECVVVAREDAPGGRRLAAYVVGEVDAGELREQLRAALPEHMVPASFTVLPSLPLTPNGKVDRKALPAPAPAEERYVAPRTPVEETLAGIWAEVLRLERVGVEEPFFELGGHSLLATRVLSRVRAAFGAELPVGALFDHPTVAQLAERVEEIRRAGVPPLPPIVPVGRAGALPLSFAQERLWFLDRMEPGRALYNIPAALRLEGAVDRPALERSLGEIVRRHEVLRTVFRQGEGGPVQVIAPFAGFALPVEDLSALDEGEREAETRRRATEDAVRPFDLAAGPLFRARLLRLGEAEHVLLVGMHHVVSDGWGLGVFSRELAALYAAYRDGRESPLPELPVQYADYAVWQREQLRGEALDRELAYWRERLAGAPALLELPTDHPRPAMPTYRGGTVPVELPAALLERLRALGRRAGATLYMVLLAAFQVLLSKYAGSEDVVVGSPIAGRTRREVEELIGFFVNTLVLRADLSGDPRFREVLRRVRAVTLGAYEHQAVPFERLVAELRPERSLSHSPLFQVMFALQNADGPGGGAPGLTIGGVDDRAVAARFDLTLDLEATSAGVRGTVTYAADLFERATAARMVGHLERVLEQVAGEADPRLSELELLGEAERRLVLEEWNRTEAVDPDPRCIHHLFEARVAAAPDAPAVVFGDESLTYAELNGRANRLARRLRRLGVGPEVRVALHLERGPEMVAGLLGVLKAGGAYVPLDPSYPAERLERMLAGSGVAVLLTQERLRGRLPIPARVRVIAVDGAEGTGEEAGEAENPGVAVPPGSLAYVIYTSGSTGTPKGVMVSHQNLVSSTLARFRFYPEPVGAYLLLSSIAFDSAVAGVFWTLCGGGALVLPGADEAGDPPRLRALAGRAGVTHLLAVPSLYAHLVSEAGAWAGRLATAIVAGEACTPDLVRLHGERLPGAALVNEYGPTETTVWSSAHRCGAEAPGAAVPIGRPVAGTRSYVLDGALRPLPAGVPGELYVGGAQVARGYLDRPAATAERFVPDPFAAEPGARMYRTGDRARWRECESARVRECERTDAGDRERTPVSHEPRRTFAPSHSRTAVLEYLGRLDEQVKVRGFRVEPGEIEAALRGCEGVAECAVVAREHGPGGTRLVAYVVGAAEAEALRAQLRRSLPDYMVPAAFVPLDRLPLTPNGKLDRRALPEPAPAPAAGGRRLTPGTDLETRLADLWRELLGVEEVGVDDNFFDLGGHSLLLAELQARLAAELGREMRLVELFEHPTVRSLAARLREMGGDASRRSATERPASGGMRGVRGRRRADSRRAGQVTRPRASARAAGEGGGGDGRTGREIAIVGMAVRVPGADDVDAFWRNLRRGVESIRFFTREELLEAGADAAALDLPGFVPAWGELRGADEIDAALFGLTPRDAEVLDPQHRVLLECAWAALEHAGCDPARAGGPVGVFAGCGTTRYLRHVEADRGLAEAVGPLRVALWNSKDQLAAGVAYRLDLRGPALAVQTACSTSLVAVHVACRSLLDRECDLALAGGATIHVPLRSGYVFSPDGILSPDGHCRAFDANARGTVGGNGAGVVVLKRLKDALRDGDTIHAVIRGSAINNDGAHKVGYTAPSVAGQAGVLRDALRAARVEPASVRYVETHGTGTPLGDAIELKAMSQAYACGGHRCAIGSVKTNVGHLDTAAGVAGLIKTVLALEHREIPPSLHCAVPHPEIAASGGRVFVNTTLRPWERDGAPRRAGVSSFGIGGTNAHAVLEEAPERAASGPSRELQLLVLSARTATALAASAEHIAGHLEREAPPLADAAHTLRVGRREMEHRLAVVCRDAEEGAARLREAAARGSSAIPRTDRPVAFLFPGVGMQYVDMGRGLYDAEPAFRGAVDECCDLLLPVLGSDLREILYSDGSTSDGEPSGGWDLRRMLGRGETEEGASPIDKTRFAQPAVFVTAYALARLWTSWGVRPRALVGHSLGEYVAACVAGVLRLEDALRLVALRARLIDALHPGAMLAVPLGEAALREILPSTLDVAAVNTPESCVVSGPASEIGAFEQVLADRGTVSRRLPARHAFHSRAMDPAAAELERLVAGFELRAPEIAFVSDVTGTWISDEDARSPAYWARHLCRTVRFADCVATLREEPGWVLLEVGPGQALGAWALQHPADGAPDRGAVFSSLRHQHNRVADLRFVLETLGGLWAAGVEVDWAAFARGERRHRVPLPGYPFERRRYWVDAPRTNGAGEDEKHGTVAEDAGNHITDASHEKGPDAMENRPAARVGSTAAASPRRDAILRDLQGIATGLTGIAEEHVATDVDFFAAGFDSLLLLQAIQAIEKRMGVRLSLVELLEEVTTLAALADHLDGLLPPDVVLNEKTDPEAPAAEAREEPAPAPLAEAPPAPAAAVLAPPAFYPASPPLVSTAPEIGTAGGESALERLAARQLQFLAQQLQIMAQQTAASHGNGNGVSVVDVSPPSIRSTPAAEPAPAPRFATASAFDGSPSSAVAVSALPAASAVESAPAPRLAAAPAFDGSASPTVVVSAPPAASAVESAPATRLATAPAIDGSASPSAVAVAAPSAAPPADGAQRTVPRSPRAKIQPETFVAYQPLDTAKPGGMTPGEKAYLDDFIARYVARTRASKAHQARYHLALADSRVTARFRRAWKEITYPIVGTRAHGTRVWDLDGNEYLDIGMSFGCNLFGHAPDFVARAIREQVESGFGVGPQSPHAGHAAELICEVGGNERAVFCNSGTEAVMGAVRAARAYTGRSKVAMFAGSYHGWSDIVQGRLFDAAGRREVRPTAPGIPALPLGDVLLLDWDEPSSLDLLARHLDEIALVMVEPVQSRRFDIQPRAFLHELRAMTRARGALLHFDELITGFRILPGGAQAFFGVDADLVTYGKIVAGGLPMGVVAGRREVMDVFDGGVWSYGDDSYPTAQRTLFAGAFFKHPISMAVAVSILEEIRRRGTPMYDALNERSARLVARLNAFFEAGGFPITTVHFGSCFRLFFGPEVRFPDLFNHHLILEGIHVIQETGTHFLCTAHTDGDLERVFQAFRASAEAMRSGGFIPGSPSGGNGSRSGAGSRATRIEVAASPAASAPASGSSPGDSDPAIDSSSESMEGGVRVLPLGEGQRQLWIESQMGDEAGCAYIESTSIRLRGALDADALRRALQALVDRHDTLRITIAPEGDAQLVHPAVRVELPLTDFRGAPAEEREARVEAWVRRTVERPFDLARGPLVRFALAALVRDEHLLVFDWHHAALDGWSFGVVWTDLCALYEAAREGRDAALPPPADHAALVRAQAAAGGDDGAAEAYWTERFADGGPVLDLPADRPRPPARTYRGARVTRVMDAALMYRLAATGRKHGLTMFNTVLSASFAWLSRLSGQDDLVVGTPSAGQAARGGAAELVGYGINVLPVRASVDAEATFVELAKQVRRAVLGAVEHQGFSFPRLVETVLRGRDPSRPPLFSVMVDLDRAAEPAPLGELRADFARNFSGGSKLDLNLELLEAPDGLRLACDFSTDLFDRDTIERWLAVFERVLEQVADDPETRISRLRLAGAEDRLRVVEEWNRTDRPFPRDACVHELFEARADRAPDALAIAWGGESLTYAQLEARANRLAHHLVRLGVGPEERVGLLLERGVEMVVATLAVMKAGGCCVPVDTSYPPERMGLMLADSAVLVLLSQGALSAPLAGSGLRVVRLDAAAEALAAEPSGRPRSGAAAENLAYVFYTSGSTGRPKGVMMGHREVVQLAACVTECMPMGPGDRVAQASNASFDAAVFEIWCALANGAALVGVDRDVLLSAPVLGDELRARGITHLYQTAALFGQHVRERVDVYASLKQLIFGAEAVDTESVRRMLRHGRPRRVLHEYGPTEATVWCTLDVVEEVAEGASTVPIGRPIPNARAYVVDGALEPLPPGVPGELYMGGAGVVRGYLGRPGLTAERFVPDPFADRAGARMYRTGDRARWRADGKLEFMGRFDHQVKLRGFRIEPGEVEGALSSCPGVREARVIVREDAPGDRRLVAYVAGEAEAGALRALLREKLPEYMVPQAFVRMERLPLNPNGKLDRAALPAPEASSSDDRYVAPRTPTEEVVAGIWAEVLRRDRVGAHENFFELGGHSLLATRVVSRIRQVFAVEVPLRALFEGSTVARLAERVEALRSAGSPRLAPVVPVDRALPLPLSFAQERLWFLDRLRPGGVFYNLPFPLRLAGVLDARALERALGEIVRRHEVLRTTFEERDGGPVQVIAPFAGFALPVEDLSELGDDEREAEMRRRASDDAARPFDLAAGPLFRARLLRLGDEDHALLLSMHHVAGDEWSLRVFFRELSALYEAYREGRESPLPDPPVQYADFAVWQRERLRDEGLDRQVAYWKDRLAGAPALLELPADRPRPAAQTHRGAHAAVDLPGELLERLQALGRREGATLYMVLLGAFQVLLSKYAGSEDVVVGSPVAGRTRAEVEELIGFFVNTLPLRTDLSGDPDFREVLRRVRQATLGAWEHQDVPFERLVEELRPERSLSHSPLVQVMFALRDPDGPWGGLSGVRAGRLETELDASKFDLTLVLGAEDGGLRGVLEYATDLFERGTIDRMLRHLERVLEEVAADAGVRLSRIDLLSDDERRRVLEEWNRTDAAPPAAALVHELFQAHADRNPGALAVAFGDEALTYGELDERASRLARFLRRRGVGPDARVAVCAERGPGLIISLLAVLKAGGAYVPLDPAYPAERLELMLADSGVSVVLTQESVRGLLPSRPGMEIVRVDAEWAEIAAESADRVESGASARSLAYVVYTSGSTGTPKGVAVEHGGLASLCAWHARAFAVAAEDRATQVASPGFDAAGWEVWPYLAAGAAIDIAPDEVRADPEGLRDWLVGRSISIAFVPTPVAEPMLGLEWPRKTALRWLLAGGDRLRARPAADLPFTLSNNYGPTECTVVATSGVVEADGARTPSIGGPIDRTRVYVLDARMQPVPIGIPGELHVGGAQVARGYLNRPGMTAERFVPDPFGGEPGARLYRTGDRVRWRECESARVRECERTDVGSRGWTPIIDESRRTFALSHSRTAVLEFLGRLDEQVKVRGFRIEPGEIEAALRRHAGVRECVVVAREDQPGDRRLAAYVVGEVDAGELREHLRATLPEHMVPASFTVLPSLPLTPNGKLDRKALPAPERDRAEGEFDEPKDPIEAQLILLWEELLGVKGIGATQSFFELGGNSMLSVRLFRQANRLFGCDLPVATLFAGATVRHMARAVLEQKRAGPATLASVVPLQPRGTLPPLFAVHSADRDVLGYVNLARHLGSDQPVFGVRDVGDDLARRVDRIAAEHVEAIRKIQPRGPYHLLSWSYGGLVAFEMGIQLERAGEAVAFIGLMDTPAPVLMDAWPWAGPVDSMLTLAHDVAKRMRRPFNMTAAELEGLEWDDQLRRVVDAMHAQGAAPPGFDAETLGEHSRIVQDRIRSRDGYVPGRFSGTLTLFRASEVQEGMDEFLAPYGDEERRTLAWSRYSDSPVEVHVVPGAHPTLGAEPHVRVLAERMRESLAAARARAAERDGSRGGRGGTAETGPASSPAPA